MKISLKNKTQWHKSVKKLVKERNWFQNLKRGDVVVIEKNIQEKLLKGFKMFYDKTHEKYSHVAQATDVSFELKDTDYGANWAFYLTNPSGEKKSVSYSCKKISTGNQRRSLKSSG